jgi:hypothetical protein
MTVITVIMALMAINARMANTLFPDVTETIIGAFNSKERSWLVIWEAGIVIEMPAGVFVMYPSSLFYHLNIDMCGKSFDDATFLD